MRNFISCRFQQIHWLQSVDLAVRQRTKHEITSKGRVLQACAGIDIMLQGPSESDHRANGLGKIVMRGEETILNYSHIRRTTNGNTHRGRESTAQLASTLCSPSHWHNEIAQRRQDKSGENRCHNLVRMCVSAELERRVPVHVGLVA